MNGKLSAFALDNYIAPKLSQLNKCNVPDMSKKHKESSHWLYNFTLNIMLRIKIEGREKQYRLFILRHAQNAFYEYQLARLLLQKYIDDLSNNKQSIELYVESLVHFEGCIAQMWQIYDQIKRNLSGKHKNFKGIYTKDDGSPHERLNMLYNISRYAGENIPDEGTVPIWITNDGLEAKDYSITFDELAKLLGEIGFIADKLSSPT